MSQQKKLIIFGLGEFAEVVEYYFRSASNYKIVGFMVDTPYMDRHTFCGAPVLATPEAVTTWPFGDHEVFVAIGYSNLNRSRREKANALSALGYGLASFVSPKAIVAKNVNVGSNCFILEHNTVQPFTTVDDNVVLWSGNHIGHHVAIGNACFITSHVVVAGGVRIGEESFIGVNATIRDHIVIGSRNIIGAAAVILDDTPDDAVFTVAATEAAPVSSKRMLRFLTPRRK